MIKKERSSKSKDPRILTDLDFIVSTRHQNSLINLMKSAHGEVKLKSAAKVLGLTEEEFLSIQEEAISKLQEEFPASAR